MCQVLNCARHVNVWNFFSPGELDHLPEVAFYMVGNIEEVVEKAAKLAEEQN